ncbi:hypothetical protein [Streptomyces sp. NPDC058872]|uniref:hypothetical protein n=1 Tax=Streptomyces sp. NPDC058872 TaxID=3346661 RepID=UPI0036A86E62
MKRSDLSTETVLTAVATYGSRAFEHLEADYPPKIVAAAMARDTSAGLLDYGVSAVRPWLTPAGKYRFTHEPERCCGCGGDYCCEHGEAPCST